MLALDAVMTIRGTAGTRTVAATDFFRSYLETAIAPDELLVDVRVPIAAGSCRLVVPRDQPAPRRLRARRCGNAGRARHRRSRPLRAASRFAASRRRPCAPMRRPTRSSDGCSTKSTIAEIASACRGRSRSAVRRPRDRRVPQAHRRRARVSNVDRCQRVPQRNRGERPIRAGSQGERSSEREAASHRRPVDGQRAIERRRAHRSAHDTGRLPPRRARAHRHASRLRARRVRRVHGPARRRGGSFVSGVRRAGRPVTTW